MGNYISKRRLLERVGRKKCMNVNVNEREKWMKKDCVGGDEENENEENMCNVKEWSEWSKWSE